MTIDAATRLALWTSYIIPKCADNISYKRSKTNQQLMLKNKKTFKLQF